MKKILNFVFTILLNTSGIHTAVAQLPVQSFSVTDSTYGRSKSSAVLTSDGYIRRISTTKFNDPYFPDPYKLRLETIDPVTGVVVGDMEIFTTCTIVHGIEDASITTDGNIVFIYTEETTGQSIWRTRVTKITPSGAVLFDTDAAQAVAGFNSQMALDILVSISGAIYVTGDMFDSLSNRVTFLWKLNTMGITDFFHTYEGVTWWSASNSIIEIQDKIVMGIKPYNMNAYLMFCNTVNGDSVAAINIGSFIPLEMTMIRFPYLTVAGHEMSGTVGLNIPGLLRINLQTSSVTPILIQNVNGSFSQVSQTANGFVAMGFAETNGKTGIFAAWMDTESQLIDSTYIDAGGILNTYPDDIIILPNRNTIVLARSNQPPTAPPPGVPLPWIYYNTDSYIVGFNALPCSLPVAQISPDTVFNCLKNPFVLQSVDTTFGNLYMWKRYSTVLSETGPTLQETRNGNYKLYVTSRTWCTKKSPNAIVVDVTPGGTVNASGPLNICIGDSVTLSVVEDSTYSYQWYKYGWPVQNANTFSLSVHAAGIYKCIISTVTGCSRVSQKVTVTVDNCAYGTISGDAKSFDMTGQMEEITIYPNPATEEILISGNKESGLIAIYDMTGNLLISGIQSLPVRIDITTLKPGMYTVVAGNMTRRFVKQ